MPLSSTTVDESVGAAVWPSAAVTQTNCFNPSFGQWRLNTRHEKPQTRTPRGSALHLFMVPSRWASHQGARSRDLCSSGGLRVRDDSETKTSSAVLTLATKARRERTLVALCMTAQTNS